MSFAPTRLTLIRRLSQGGGEEDWRQFLQDYWGSVCRFAAGRGGLSWADAEDVAAETFAAIVSNDLLRRWYASRSAKLRTLICAVARNVMSNRARVAQGRQRRLQQYAREGPREGGPRLGDNADPSFEEEDAFYSAWVELLLQRTIDSLMLSLHGAGKGDHFRVLYGRLCEGSTMAQISEALGVSRSRAENYYKTAKTHLTRQLRMQLYEHVQRYCDESQASDEFESEWARLAEHLERSGGLAQAVQEAYERRRLAGASPEPSSAFRAALAAGPKTAPPNAQDAAG